MTTAAAVLESPRETLARLMDENPAASPLELLGSLKAVHAVDPKAVLNPTYRALTALPEEVRHALARLVDQATSAARLTLALHEMEGDAPEARVAWEAFGSCVSVAEGLAYMLGIEDPTSDL